MNGDLYEATADWSVGQLARRLADDINDVQGDGLLPAAMMFEVTGGGHSDDIQVLEVRIAGRPGEADGGDLDSTLGCMRIVFELASHYNRVDLRRPQRARFVQHITAVSEAGTPYGVLVGAMLGDGRLDPPHADDDRLQPVLDGTAASHPMPGI